jgi:hypothetical protein
MTKKIVITIDELEGGNTGKIGIESGGLSPLQIISILEISKLQIINEIITSN